jgi:hypothetical protein
VFLILIVRCPSLNPSQPGLDPFNGEGIGTAFRKL